MHRCYRECAYMRGIPERLRSVITTSRSDTNPRLPYFTLPAHGNDSYTLNDFKGISVWRDRGALVTLRFQCVVYKSIYLLTYFT